jgi:outer membrane receptor protein involved in Fe transport
VYYSTVGIGTLSSNGIEFDLEQKITDDFKVYGNAAYHHARWDNRYPFGSSGNFDIVENTNLSTYDLEPTAVPTYTWNLGLYYDFQKNLSYNIHYRGHARTHVKIYTDPAGFETQGAEHYVDMNLNFAPSEHWTGSVYVKNLFDNDSPLAHINSGVIEQYFRRQFGFRLEAKF